MLLTLLTLLTSLASLAITETSVDYNTTPTAIATSPTLSLGWLTTGNHSFVLAPEQTEGHVADTTHLVNATTQTAYQIRVADKATGRTIIDTRKQQSAQSQHVSLTIPTPFTAITWQVRIWTNNSSKPTDWSQPQTILYADSTSITTDSHWIGAITRHDAHIPTGRWSNGSFKKQEFVSLWQAVDTLSRTSITLHHNFKTDKKKIRLATLHISGLGHYEAQINNQPVSDDMFAPLWSEYDKTVYFNSYDVTDILATNTTNHIAVILGNGFYNTQKDPADKHYAKLQNSYGPPALRARLVITYEDGTTQHITTNDSWTWTANPLTFNHIYGGETYDARLANNASHHSVKTVEGPKGTLTPQTAPPVRILERLSINNQDDTWHPIVNGIQQHYTRQWLTVSPDSLATASQKTKRTIAPTVLIADMGQNIAGFPEITVRGRRGQTITILTSENLNQQGVCDQRQTGRQHYYQYTLGSDEPETYHPHFTYYGFRYIQVEGAVREGDENPDQLPVIEDLKSCVVGSTAHETSQFDYDDLYNNTHRLILRAVRSNMQAVLTDCPHREKLGWLEQDHLCATALLYNYDLSRYIPKIIRDIADTQKANGMVPTTAPQYVSFGNLFDDSPEWGSTLILLPYIYYQYYDDATLAERYYDNMARYVSYLTSRLTDDGTLDFGLGDWYDYTDGPSGFAKNTPVGLVATAYYILDLQTMIKIARLTNHEGDIEAYENQLVKSIECFNRRYLTADSRYATDSQTSYALPLYLGIVPDSVRATVFDRLTEVISSNNYRLTTGDVGNRYLFMTLAENGRNDLVHRLIDHYETPGYGSQLLHGATTLTEQWDPRNGTSWNHFMMGQIDEWFWKYVAGLRQAEGSAGMRRLLIDVTELARARRASFTLRTLMGEVSVSRCEDGSYVVSLPMGVEAMVVGR